ncbi:hypothetical protein [uncultured Sulfitobacter sp.]|uniref:hypothetical protein n=1 Tax=uncultured Sulfitobacter sp. TaxID=191468 RepID=UPI0026194ABC|nr:hypothetical protein [uncultured Sulfitobacter sp.]
MTVNATNVMPKSKNPQVEKIKDRAKDQTSTIEFRVLTVVLTALMLWGAAIATFGYPALILVALALVPVMFCFLLLITVGK